MALKSRGIFKSHWKEIAVIASIFSLCLGFAIFFLLPKKGNEVASISFKGKELFSISLAKEREERHVEIEAEHGTFIIGVRENEICVHMSSCPSQFCVHQGWSKGEKPIICAYNGVSITFSNDNGEKAVIG